MSDVIITKNVSKKYKSGLQAVQGVSLRIKRGEIYGFIGLNGAGKTTLIRMLLGMIQPTEGSCYINGNKITRTAYKTWEHVGYMVETPFAYPELTVKENLTMIHKLRLLKDLQALNKIMDTLKLAQYKHTKASNLSLGNAQRLGIAKALIHKPAILILDEPMNGLDPEGIVEIRNLLRDLAFNHGVTIFISSHILSEVAKIATTIGIIHKGKLIEEIDRQSLQSHLHKRLIINTNNNASAYNNLIQMGFTPKLTNNNTITLYDQKALEHPDKIATLLVHKGTPPIQLMIKEENLEDYFLNSIHLKGESINQ